MAGKGAAASAMEAAANIAASAKSGLQKTKAVVEEKVEKMTRSDPTEKDMATIKKEEKIMHAELSKKEAYAQNAAASTGGNARYTAEGTGDLLGHDHPHQVPVVPHRPMAERDCLVTEDVVGSHYAVGTAVGVVEPQESNTGMGRTPVGGPTGTTKGVVGSQYPVGENTGVGENMGSGRTPVHDPKTAHISTTGGMHP